MAQMVHAAAARRKLELGKSSSPKQTGTWGPPISFFLCQQQMFSCLLDFVFDFRLIFDSIENIQGDGQ